MFVHTHAEVGLFGERAGGPKNVPASLQLKLQICSHPDKQLQACKHELKHSFKTCNGVTLSSDVFDAFFYVFSCLLTRLLVNILVLHFNRLFTHY